MIYRIFTRAADPNDLNAGERFYFWFDLWHVVVNLAACQAVALVEAGVAILPNEI
ncbi:MAG: hypothetical protein Q8O98_00615 [bacterium]|nr:hypothetical protein [bacterium]